MIIIVLAMIMIGFYVLYLVILKGIEDSGVVQELKAIKNLLKKIRDKELQMVDTIEEIQVDEDIEEETSCPACGWPITHEDKICPSCELNLDGIMHKNLD